MPWTAVKGFKQVKIFGQFVLELQLQPGIGATTAGVRGLDQPAVRTVVKPSPLLKPTGLYLVKALDQPVHVIDQAGMPFLGTGEAAQGPTAAAVGNAIRDAIGKRLYDLPLTRQRGKAAIGV